MAAFRVDTRPGGNRSPFLLSCQVELNFWSSAEQSGQV